MVAGCSFCMNKSPRRRSGGYGVQKPRKGGCFPVGRPALMHAFVTPFLTPVQMSPSGPDPEPRRTGGERESQGGQARSTSSSASYWYGLVLRIASCHSRASRFPNQRAHIHTTGSVVSATNDRMISVISIPLGRLVEVVHRAGQGHVERSLPAHLGVLRRTTLRTVSARVWPSPQPMPSSRPSSRSAVPGAASPAT